LAPIAVTNVTVPFDIHQRNASMESVFRTNTDEFDAKAALPDVAIKPDGPVKPRLNALCIAASDLRGETGPYSKLIVHDLVANFAAGLMMIPAGKDGHKSLQHMLGLGTGIFKHPEAPVLLIEMVVARALGVDLEFHAMGRTAFEAANKLADAFYDKLFPEGSEQKLVSLEEIADELTTFIETQAKDEKYGQYWRLADKPSAAQLTPPGT
jgi:hypothetical protein